jgi:nucleoside-diphosphate-sugar epimerase
MLADGYHVIAGIRKGCNRELIEKLDLEFRYGDVTHPETLPAMVNGVDYIIHNAGLVKAKNTEQFFKINHFGTASMAEASLGDGNLKKFILISSLAAGGVSPPGKPITEKDQPRPITEYGRSKLAGEEAVLALSDRINVCVIRPPGVYGPGDREMFTFFQIVNRHIRPFLGKSSRKIQLVHVDDLCRGVSRALGADTKSDSIYYIAESTSYSYKELVDMLGTAVGRWGFPLYVPGWLVMTIAAISENIMKFFGKAPMFTTEKASEILGNWEMSTDKARGELGFISKIPFADGARETVGWYRQKGWL